MTTTSRSSGAVATYPTASSSRRGRIDARSADRSRWDTFARTRRRCCGTSGVMVYASANAHVADEPGMLALALCEMNNFISIKGGSFEMVADDRKMPMSSSIAIGDRSFVATTWSAALASSEGRLCLDPRRPLAILLTTKDRTRER